MSCLMSIEQKLCGEKIFQVQSWQSKSIAIRCIDQRFAFKNYGISCLAKNRCQVARYDKSYTFFFSWLIRTYGSMVTELTVTQRVGWLGFDSRRELKLSLPLGHFSWHWAYQCTDTRAFILLRSLFLGFHQWQSRADRVLTLNMSIRLPLFWSDWSRAQGPDSATCTGLVHGRDYRNCRAPRSKSHKRCSAHVFPWIVENAWKQGPTARVFQPSQPRLGNVKSQISTAHAT